MVECLQILTILHVFIPSPLTRKFLSKSYQSSCITISVIRPKIKTKSSSLVALVRNVTFSVLCLNFYFLFFLRANIMNFSNPYSKENSETRLLFPSYEAYITHFYILSPLIVNPFKHKKLLITLAKLCFFIS